MLRFLITCLVGVLALPSVSSAQQLTGSITFIETLNDVAFNGATFDPVPFDVYHVIVTNETGEDLFTLLNASASGPFLVPAPDVDLQTGTDLAASPFDAVVAPVGDNFTADSFFTTPAGNSAPSGVTDTTSTLASDAIASLQVPWIPNGGSAVVAVLSVAGGTDPDLISFSGGFALSGQEIPIDFNFIPEPTTCMLAGLGVAGVVARRRRV